MKLDSKISGFVVIAILLLLTICIEKIDEFPIVTNPSDQWYPAIYEETVVWQDKRNGNWDIYGYDLFTKQEFRITKDKSDQERPAIYRKIIVWEDNRHDQKSICGYNDSSEEEFPIAVKFFSLRNPVIYGDIIIWSDGDIAGYNLITDETLQIAIDQNEQSHPAIYEYIVVWQDKLEGDFDIRGYNLFTKEKFPIATGRNDQSEPVIHGDIVAWTNSGNGSSEVYGLNLVTREQYEITKDSSNQSHPAVYGEIVVWQDDRNGNWDIYGYDLSVKKEFQITTNKSDQKYPEIYGDIIVWHDNRNGNWDIYGCRLPSNPAASGIIGSIKELLRKDALVIGIVGGIVVGLSLIGIQAFVKFIRSKLYGPKFLLKSAKYIEQSNYTRILIEIETTRKDVEDVHFEVDIPCNVFEVLTSHNYRIKKNGNRRKIIYIKPETLKEESIRNLVVGVKRKIPLDAKVIVVIKQKSKRLFKGKITVPVEDNDLLPKAKP